MKHVRILLSLLFFSAFNLAGGAASAQTSCNLSDTLKRIHASSVKLYENPVGGIMASNLRRVKAELSFLDRRAVSDQINMELDGEDERLVLAHLNLMYTLVEVSQSDDSSRLQVQLFDPANLALVKAASPAFAQLACTPFASDSKISANRSTSAEADQIQSEGSFLNLGAFSVETSFIGLLVLILLAAATWIANLYFGQQIKKRRSRAKRYYIYTHVTFATGAVNHRGKLLDISRLGTKLQHGGRDDVQKDAKIKLFVDGCWLEGRVMWSGNECCGVKFSTMLSRVQFKSIRKAARTNLPSTAQNGGKALPIS